MIKHLLFKKGDFKERDLDGHRIDDYVSDISSDEFRNEFIRRREAKEEAERQLELEREQR